LSITERIDAITLVEAKQSTLPAPKSVKIELTGQCNFRCGFCALRMREEQPTKPMDWKFFTRVAKEMRDAGVEELGLFFLGESFSSPELLLKAVQHAKVTLGFPYVFLTTNGSLAKPHWTWACMDAGLDSLKFSINWADKQQFHEITGVKTALFDKALENLKAAREIRDAEGYKCGIYASSIAFDGEQASRMEKLLAERVLPYVDEHYFLPLYSMGSFATKREEELGFRPIAGNQGRLGKLREPLPCWSAFTEGHITSQGKLSACCFDASASWEMADLNKVSFMDGWNSEKFVSLREAHLKKDVRGTICASCIAYR